MTQPNQPLICDSHAHLVSPDQTAYPPKPVSGNLAPGEFDSPNSMERFLALMGANGVTMSCAVQRAHIYGYDNSYILDCAASVPDRLRAVVVLNAAAGDTPAVLSDLVRNRGAAGVRYVSPGFPTTSLDWLTSAEAAASFKAAADLGIPICIHVLNVQRDAVLPEVRRIAMAHPDARFVIDHVGGAHPAKIEQQWLAGQGLTAGAEFTDGALALADFGNVTMKLSTINLESSPDPAAFTAEAVRRFGAERLIWGSDIGQSRGDYGQMVTVLHEVLAQFDEPERRAILHDNALALYGPR